MTALWFACQPPSRQLNVSASGVLIALNVDGWERYGRRRPASSRAALNDPLGWELNEALASNDPFVVESILPNDRLRAQEGYFVSSTVPAQSSQRGPFSSLRISYSRLPIGVLGQKLLGDNNPLSGWRERLPFVAVKVRSHLKHRVLTRLEASYRRVPSVLFPDFSGFRDFSDVATPRGSFKETLGSDR